MDDKSDDLTNESYKKIDEQEKPKIKKVFISDKARSSNRVRSFEDINWFRIKQTRFQGFIKKLIRTREPKYF